MTGSFIAPSRKAIWVFIAFRHLVHSRPSTYSDDLAEIYWDVFIAFRHLVHSRRVDSPAFPIWALRASSLPFGI
ncbi:MAG: hypothetical protein M2R45_03561 [Verrucomicrobia subdivision 3 bacterium]|nr:hypothetical protein [Limisphaerales bacterium]MCS1416462.1 hypothetical protein [Limisphaerales bacterium]